MRARAILLLFAVLTVSLGGLVQPAAACGCGAMVANDRIDVGAENSIVRWEGRTEQIVMRLAVDTVAPDAAFIFPTPAPATVKLGDKSWFGQIDALTKPLVRVHRDWWGDFRGFGAGGADRTGVGAPGGGVQVLSEQRLGDLVVATLDATDASALSGWLGDHGYQLRPELTVALDRYVKAHWKYVAVKLAPKDGRALRGQLEPLHLSFASTELVYPMALSHGAARPQQVHLWIVAPHRVQRVDSDAADYPPSPEFAGPAAGIRGELGDFVGAGQWLTEFADTYRPDQINSDWKFAYTADQKYRQVDDRTEVVRIGGVPAGWFLVGLGGFLGFVLLLVTFIVVAVRHGQPRVVTR